MIMRRILIAILLTGALAGWGKTISNIDRNGAWYYIYDEKGKKSKAISANSIGVIKGWCGEFFIAQNGSWIGIYNPEGRKLKTMSKSSIGEVISVSGNTFTTRNGNWIYTYDSTGKKISTRPAR